MKTRLLLLFTLAWFSAFAQPSSGKYTPIEVPTNQKAIYFRNLNMPVRGANDTTIAYNIWPWAGYTIYDSVNNRLLIKGGDGVFHQTGGSGGGGSLQTSTDLGNTTTKSITTGAKDSIGYVYRYFMPTNPIDPTIGKTGSATLAVDGNKMLITGGGRNLSNYLDFPMKFGWWNFTITFKTVVHHKGGTSGGLGVAVVAAGAGTSVMWSFMQHDTAAYVNYSPAVQLPQLTDENNKANVDWRFNNYDTVEYTVQRRGRSFTAKQKDVTTGIESRLHLDDRMFNAVGNLRLYIYSDSLWFVDSLRIKADEVKNPVAMILSDSWGYGGDASTEANTHVIKSTSGRTAIFSAGPSEQSLQGTYRFGDLASAVPQMGFWEYAVNDINSSGGGAGAVLDSFCKRTIRFIQLCQSIGTVPILATPGPQVTDGTKYKDSINAIGARYSVRVMPVFETLKDTTQVYLAAKYVGNSAVHMNDNGHDVYAQLERFEMDRLGMLRAPTINWPSIPKSSYFKYELGLDDAGNPVAMPARTNPNYLWAISGTINNLTVPQYGSGSYIGNWWWVCNPEFIITPLGTSPASAPYFKVDAVLGVQTRVLYAGLGGLVVNTTSTTLNTNPLNINVPFVPQSIPLIVKANGFATAKNILSLNSVPSTWSITDTLFAAHRNDTLKSYIDPFGGMRTNWKSGYMHPMDYTGLGVNDFPTKAHIDSLIALVVAGSAGLTGVTDGNGFDLTALAGNVSVKTQYTGGKVMFADNTAAMLGTDSLKWVSGQLWLNQYHTTLPQIRVGDVGITAFSLNNYWIGPIKYNSGFKYITSGSYAPHIYFNAGSIDMNVTSSTGSVDAAATVLTAFHIDKTGKLGDAGVAAPNSWHQLSAGTTALAPLTFQAGTNLTTPVTGAVEYDGTSFFATNSTPTRQVIITGSTATPLTSGTTPVATTGGKLTDGLILDAGQFTPSLTSVANVGSSSVSSNALYYQRTGAYVMCTLIFTITPTITLTDTQIDFSLPIASNIGASTDLKGNGTVVGSAFGTCIVTGDVANDRAHVDFTSAGTGAHTVSITFQYKII